MSHLNKCFLLINGHRHQPWVRALFHGFITEQNVPCRIMWRLPWFNWWGSGWCFWELGRLSILVLGSWEIAHFSFRELGDWKRFLGAGRLPIWVFGSWEIAHLSFWELGDWTPPSRASLMISSPQLGTSGIVFQISHHTKCLKKWLKTTYCE